MFMHMRLIIVNMHHNFVDLLYNHVNMEDNPVSIRLKLSCMSK